MSRGKSSKNKSGVLRAARRVSRAELPQFESKRLQTPQEAGSVANITIGSFEPVVLRAECKFTAEDMVGLLAAWRYLINNSQSDNKLAIENLYEEESYIGFDKQKWTKSEVLKLFQNGSVTNYNVGTAKLDPAHQEDFPIDNRMFFHIVEGVAEALMNTSSDIPERKDIELTYHRLLNSFADKEYPLSRTLDDGLVKFAPTDLIYLLNLTRQLPAVGTNIQNIDQIVGSYCCHQNNSNYAFYRYLTAKQGSTFNQTEQEQIATGLEDLVIFSRASKDSKLVILRNLAKGWL